MKALKIFAFITTGISVSLFSQLLLINPSSAYTQIFSNPIIKNLPVDATVVEWDGMDETGANTEAANLFCRSQGLSYAVSWFVTKNDGLTQNGTTRFRRSGNTEVCGFCRWRLETVRCYRP